MRGYLGNLLTSTRSPSNSFMMVLARVSRNSTEFLLTLQRRFLKNTNFPRNLVGSGAQVYVWSAFSELLIKKLATDFFVDGSL